MNKVLRCMLTGLIILSICEIQVPHKINAALLLSTPLKGDSNGDGKVTSLEIKQRLQNTSKDLGISGMDDTYGSGLLDVYGAMTQ